MKQERPCRAPVRPAHASRHALGVAAYLALALFLAPAASANQKVLARKRPAQTYSAISANQVAALTQRGITVVEDYGPFLLLDAPDNADIATAGTASSLWITKDPYARTLRLAGFEVDTSTGAITGTLDPDLQVSDYNGAAGLYLVQFHGPLNVAWLKPLTAYGMRVLGYVESNGFIVAAPRGLDALKSKFLSAPVQYIGVFQPGFKLPPSLRQVAATDVSGKPMTALLDGGQDLTATYAQLKAIDAGFSIQGDIGIGTRVSFQATAAQARMLTRLGTVLFVEIIPEGRASDERAAELALGINWPGHYTDWLASHYLGNLYDCPNPIAGCAGRVHILDSGVQLSPDGNGAIGCIRGNDDNYPGPYTGHIDLNSESNRTRLFMACSGPGGYWTADGYYHGTLVASIIAGNPAQDGGGLFSTSVPADSGGYLWGTGLAPTASFLTTKYISNGGQLYPQPSYTAWADAAVVFQATKQNNSWNLVDTAYSTASAEYDRIVRDTGHGPIEVVFSAGNGSPTATFTWAPATAKNVISVGASGPTSTDPRIPSTCRNPTLGLSDLEGYSNRGFAGNGTFVKPDLVAPGLATGARSNNNDGTHWDCSLTALGIDPDNAYYVGRGTSFAAPQVTGASVLVDTLIRNGTSLFPNNFNPPCCPSWWPAPSLIKAVLIGSAETMNGGDDYATPPPHQKLQYEPGPQGWGRLSLKSFLDSAYKTVGNEDWSRTFYSTGASFNFNLTVYDPSKPVILVLVWTDAPGSGTPSNPIVNQLALNVWQGLNYYCDGLAYRNPTQQYLAPRPACTYPPDTTNNVKVIKIAPGMSGQFTMQVYGWSLSTHQNWSAYVYNAHL